MIMCFTFVSSGSLGKFLSEVSPTLIMLSDSSAVYSSVKPSMTIALLLSRFSSVT